MNHCRSVKKAFAPASSALAMATAEDSIENIARLAVIGGGASLVRVTKVKVAAAEQATDELDEVATEAAAEEEATDELDEGATEAAAEEEATDELDESVTEAAAALRLCTCVF